MRSLQHAVCACTLTLIPSSRIISLTITARQQPPRHGNPAASSSTTSIQSNRPTHFIALRLPDPALHDHVTRLQQEIISREPGARGCEVEPIKSHLTGFVMSLPDAEAVATAKVALASCASLVEAARPPPLVHLVGLGAFGQRVCYVAVKEDSELARVRALVAGCAKSFSEHGLSVQQAGDWIPHMTLLKTSRAPRGGGRGRGRARGRGQQPRIRPATYSDLSDADFGVHALTELALCQMAGTAADGFYPTVAALPTSGGH